MLIHRLAISAALCLALIGLGKAFEVSKLVDGNMEGVVECLESNNISLREFLIFFDPDNLENLLNETVELKYKCLFKCVMEKQLKKGLHVLGNENLLKTLKATSGFSLEIIIGCMDSIPEDSCSFIFNIVVCGLKNRVTTDDYDSDYETEETATLSEEEVLELTTESSQ